MTSTSVNSVYQPLDGSEIRLICIKPGTSDTSITCELQKFLLETSPSYCALSYVWGDEKDTRPITVNGQSFNVTINLFTGLQELRKWQQAQKPIYQNVKLDLQTRFWIDAICINQANIKEKSEQIPRMGKIYGAADQVIAWLGPNRSEEDVIVREVFEKANQLDVLYRQPEFGLAAIPAFASYMAEAGGTTDLGAFCDAMVSVIRRPWFSRVWVLQEAVLARGPAILLAGRAATTVHNLYFLWATLRMYVKDGSIRQGLIAGIRIGHFESTRLEVQSEEWRIRADQTNLETFGRQLYGLLDRATGHLKSNLPQDMIYGLLGMTDIPQLPEDLKPDYEKPWCEVFRNYSRFLIESTGNLALMPTTANDLVGEPSWVPDLREQRFGSTGLNSEPPTSASVTFSRDGKCVTVEGVEVCTVVSSFQAPRDCMHDILALSEALPRFENVIIRQVCRIADISREHILKRWLSFLVESSHFNAFSSVVDDFYEIYSRIVNREPSDNDKHENIERLEAIDDGFSGNASPTDRLALVHLLQESLGGLSHFVTTEGTIGMLMRHDSRAQQGDRICVFKGSIYPSLIRPWGENYIFMGGCRVNNKFSEDPESEKAHDEAFFNQYMLRDFTLV